MRKAVYAAGAAAFWAVSALAAPPTDDAGARLESGEQLRIKVFEWRSSVGDVHEWAALNGDYRIAADGKISLPLLGPMDAAGATPEQLSEAISGRLQTSLGLTIKPQASVEIVQYPPFYILGDVSKPGEYPYTPGLTILQAISIAGGKYRVNNPALVLTTAGELKVLRLQYNSLLARRARLQAQLDNANAIDFPPELQRQQKDPDVAQLMAREHSIFTSQRDALHAQLDALSQLKSLLNGEVASLQAKMKIVDQELDMMKQELNRTANMVQQGLATAPREFSQRQTEIETQSRRLDLDTAALRAKEDIGKADQAILELRNKTRGDVQTQLAEVEQKIPETAARIASSMTIVDREAGNGAAAEATDSPSKSLILRRDAHGVKAIEADETTPLRAGDTIKVLRVGEKPPAAAAAAKPAAAEHREHEAVLVAPPRPR